MTSDYIERRKAQALERLAAVAEEENERKWKKEKFTQQDADKYKEGIRFTEIIAILIIVIGLGIIRIVWYLGLILIIAGGIWTYKNFKKGRKRVINTREYLHTQVGKKNEEMYNYR